VGTDAGRLEWIFRPSIGHRHRRRLPTHGGVGVGLVRQSREPAPVHQSLTNPKNRWRLARRFGHALGSLAAQIRDARDVRRKQGSLPAM